MSRATRRALANYEFKNEMKSISSEPNVQNVGYFIHSRKDLPQERAPMLLMSVVGCHYFQVFGAVWNKGDLCVDPLCSPVSLLFVPCDPAHGVTKTAHVLAALDAAVDKLDHHYQQPKRKDNHGPYFHSFDGHALVYGKNIGKKDRLFNAKLVRESNGAKEEVVVKFVRFRYGTEVHRLLAEKNLAPRLIHCQKLSGGWIAMSAPVAVVSCIGL